MSGGYKRCLHWRRTLPRSLVLFTAPEEMLTIVEPSVARVRSPPRLSEVPVNVLTLLAVGLTIWLCFGALVAQLFGALVDGGRQSREDEQGTADTESQSRP